MRACFLDAGTLGNGLDWSALTAAVDDWRRAHHCAPHELDERLQDVEVAITNKVVIDADAIARASRLRLICVAATGYNNVDIDAAAARGVAVVNVAGYATPSVSQHVLALVLGHATRWPRYADDVRRGAWSASELFCRLDHPIEELAGQTLGVVGYGALGRAVARLAEAFGMRVLVAERTAAAQVRAGRVAFSEVLARADVLTLHCPLTAANAGLIDAAALARMKPGAFVVNTARGGLIDNTALIDALREQRIGGAAIDVLDAEPPPADHPLLADDIPNLIVTPHSAWGSRGARQRLLDGVAANIRAFTEGKTPNRVN